ncbi:hypothetical protein ACHHV8_32950 [Paenibacillus sp. TAB 01]
MYGEEGENITEETEWIERTIAGDKEAFRCLMDKYGPYLFHVVYSGPEVD